MSASESIGAVSSAQSHRRNLVGAISSALEAAGLALLAIALVTTTDDEGLVGRRIVPSQPPSK